MRKSGGPVTAASRRTPLAPATKAISAKTVSQRDPALGSKKSRGKARAASAVESEETRPPHPATTRPRPEVGRPGMLHVALLIETSGSYGRGLLRGVSKYNREHGGWSTYFHPHGLGDPPPPWMTNWKGDGILARIDTPEIAELLLKSGVPVVNLRGTIGELP